MTDEQIKHMVDRFLNYKLPENWKPDGGVSFEKFGNKGTPHQYTREPSGTNLLDASQAEVMVRHMVEGLWKTIETAPRDGTHILAWRIPIGIRVTNNTHPPTVVHWFDDEDEPGFYTSVNELAPEHPFNPTHWMPLPTPPITSKER